MMMLEAERRSCHLFFGVRARKRNADVQAQAGLL